MKPALIVHGGAGLWTGLSAGEATRGAAAALRAGGELLAQGGSALDAVELAVRTLEDDPLFNAGTGSVLTSEGDVELDAAIMAGDLRLGGVAAVRRIRNPISLARRVMEQSPHVLLAGHGAELFARDQGIPLCSPAELITTRALERHRERLAETKHGTVGAVACDQRGELAAATSTGGIALKLPGRVGDSPVPGAGLYADGELGAASATGAGEAILRVLLCRHAVELLREHPPGVAARLAIESFARRTGADAGVIVVNRTGETGYAFNTRKMCRAFFASDGAVDSALEEAP